MTIYIQIFNNQSSHIFGYFEFYTKDSYFRKSLFFLNFNP